MKEITIDGVEYDLTPKQEPELLFNDWRLPTRAELATLINDKKCDPACDLLDTVSYFYWSYTTDAYDTNYVWIVCFNYGFQTYRNKTNSNYVRFVRDSEHGLQWTKSYGQMVWNEAIRFAETLIAPAYHSL